MNYEIILYVWHEKQKFVFNPHMNNFKLATNPRKKFQTYLIHQLINFPSNFSDKKWSFSNEKISKKNFVNSNVTSRSWKGVWYLINGRVEGKIKFFYLKCTSIFIEKHKWLQNIHEYLYFTNLSIQTWNIKTNKKFLEYRNNLMNL